MTAPATPRGLLFGAAAESYERFRPGYPDEVVDRTLRFAGRSVLTALEIGAGTGKATRAFASRGIRITALEPDRSMFAVLQRETAGMPVTPVHAGFEEYDGEAVELVYAASALHWTDPTDRWALIARLLVPGGVVANFGSFTTLADEGLRAAVEEVEQQFLADRGPPVMTEVEGRRWPAWELDRSEEFTDVQDLDVPRAMVLPRKEYVGYLSTVSAYLRLPIRERQEALSRVADVLPEQVRVEAPVPLCLARAVG
jgi:SAM-dependent methyltransferase